jgi:hypothetical protein
VIRAAATHAGCPGADGSAAAHEDGTSLPKPPETESFAMSAGGAANGLAHVEPLELATVKAAATRYRLTKSGRQQVVAALADTSAAEHGNPAGRKVLLNCAV